METKDSLQIILNMIDGAKSAYQKISPYFILWGIYLAIAGILEFILVYQLGMKSGFLVWPIAGVIGGIGSMIISRRESKKSQVRTYYDITFKYLWVGFSIALALIITISIFNRVNPTPHTLILTGLPTLVTGGMVKSKSLVAGAIIFWICGIISFIIPQPYTGLLFSLAIILGYVLPGIQLNKSEKNNLNSIDHE